MQDTNAKLAKPKVGVSGCLLGQEVRYNGVGARDRFVFEELSTFFDWLPVCPEVGAGMGIPRETVRLTGNLNNPALTGTRSGTQWQDAMAQFTNVFLEGLAERPLHGFILKSKSPSCGMARIPVYHANGHRIGRRAGLFAHALRQKFPMLPIEEAGRLNDAGLREQFSVAVYACQRWCEFMQNKPGAGQLVAFHMRHKLLLMSRNQLTAKKLGRIAANPKKQAMAHVLEKYGRLFSKTLMGPATPGNHANTLFHALGFLKNHLTAEDKQELIGCIHRYRAGRVPLSVPMVLLSHHLRKFPQPWLQVQTYMAPCPAEFPITV